MKTDWPTRVRAASAARAVGLAAAVLAAACTPQNGSPTGGSAGSERSAAPRRIAVGIMSAPPAIAPGVTPGASLPGQGEMYQLVEAGLTRADDQGQVRPLLADAVPSVENGRWRLLPDGRMETDWSIRERALWQDGTPLTADDVLFTAIIGQDRELPLVRDPAYDAVERVEASDSQTITVYWKRPYIDADGMFGLPLPRHLLERPYLDDKAAYTQLPYWTESFIGTGPYKLRSWDPGSGVSLEAFDGYILGRPKIDEIEVKFIADPNALAANVLAGAVEVTLGKSLSLDQAIQLQEQWRAGRMDTAPSNSILIYPQFINTDPPIVTDKRFRKALMHATDRQELVDTIMYGRTVVAHSFLKPDEPDYQATLGSVIQYEYDTRKAAQMLEGLGYAKGVEGFFRDVTGREVAVEIRTNHVDTNQKAILAIADQWQRLGVKVEPTIMSEQSQTDAAYVTTFPAFLLYRQPSTVSELKNQHRSLTPLPENNFRGRNYSRYQGPEFSNLIDQLFMTVPRAERTEILKQALYYVSDELIRMGLFYDVQPVMTANRIQGITDSAQGWNAHEWEVK